MAKDTRNFWKRHREDVLDISQRKLATRLGVSNTSVSQWETDLVVPSLADASKLADGYELSREEVEREIVAQTRRIGAAAVV